MDYVTHYKCTLCQKSYEAPVDFYTCPSCGETGILDVLYDLDKLKLDLSRDTFAARGDFSMWRYAPLLPVKETHMKDTLRVGWTPLYASKRLKDTMGLKRFHIKDEGMNPTGSLKDRASAVAVLKALEVGNTTIACSSTGNAASSLAGNAARLGVKTVIFVPSRAPKGKLSQLIAFGARVVRVEGDYKAAYNLSKAAIGHFGWYNRNAAINAHMVEGKKTVAFEIVEQLDFHPPDWVVVSVGDGCTIAGVHKGFKELEALGLTKKTPRLLGVQSVGCAPFFEAAKEGRGLRETNGDTIADSIAVGIPRNPVKALRAVKETSGEWVTVTDEAILEAVRTLGKEEGVFAEPAAAASLAGLEKALREGIIGKDEHVVLVSTGNGLKDTLSMKASLGRIKNFQGGLEELIEYFDKDHHKGGTK